MTKKEFIKGLKAMGFTQLKFVQSTCPEYFYIYLQHVQLSVVFSGEKNKTIGVYVRHKTDLDYNHNVLLKKAEKTDETFLKKIKKMVNFFA